jgi:hypothetical protein
MKTQQVKMFLALGAVSTIGIGLHAQTYELKANIPFAFQVNNQAFAPGKYEVRRGNEAVPSLMPVATGHRSFVIGANPSLSGKADPRLVFHCYGGDKCFLAEIWPTSGAGCSVPKSKAEKELINGDAPREMATIAIDLHRAD